MSDEFRFDIGDLVVSVSQQVARITNFDFEPKSPGLVLQIEERITQECIGGVQRFYKCRAANREAVDSTQILLPVYAVERYVPKPVEEKKR